MDEEDYLAQLIAFQSVSENKAESKKCAEHCLDFFKSHGLHAQLFEYNGYPSVVATTQPTKSPKIFLQGHMDVVPAEQNLFKLKKADDKLMGRGAFDMKFAAASYMKLLERLGPSVNEHDFGIMLTFDEEVGGHNGVEALLNDGYSCDVCILPDSGKDWRLENSAKGAWFMKVVKKGKNAHGSRPHDGINAAERLMPTVDKILAIRDDYEYEDLSLNLTMLSAGEAMNQIPDKAEATFDIRYRTEDIYKTVHGLIDQICHATDARIETLEKGMCLNYKKDNVHIKRFVPIAEEVIGREIVFGNSPGATDGRYFCAKGIPTIIIQPNGGDRHGDDEWIEVGGMEKLTEILLRYIREYAKIS